MTRTTPRLLVSTLLFAGGFAGVPSVAAAPARPVTLSNGQITAQLGDRGLVSIADATLGATYRFRQDDFAIAIGGTTYDSGALPAPARKAGQDRVTYTWTANPYRLEVVYELKPGWRFVSKQVVVASAPAGTFRVDAVTVFRAAFAESVADVYVPKSARPNLGTGDYGGCLRFAGSNGLLAVVQNPFLEFRRETNAFSIRYKPDIDWRTDEGPFAADRGLLAPYRLTGRRLPERMRPEWQLDPTDAPPGMDAAEVDAFTELVRLFLIYRPAKPLNLFVGWCVNDYQIDAATPEGRAEYRRILDRAAELGAEYVLYAPTNSDLSRRVESADDWSWENLLWLGLGQKIRKGEWDPRTDAVPPSVQDMLDYARAKHLKLVAYVYPVVPFSQNPAWLVAARNNPNRKYASLGVRGFQDWLIDTLVAFHQKTGIGGYAFDHTFLGYDGTSRYAQWSGWRRVMEELRRRVPDIAIDGRQAYHLYGPWSWLAGSYPHPTFNDEQPESFVPFPDLHFDRVSADRERYTAYRYKNYEFAPSEIVPGFITHQTSRSDDTGDMPQVKTDTDVKLSRFRAHDCDYLGWRYSLLSSIAIAGWNNVLNMIPARDLDEHRHFSEGATRWFRRWIEWTDINKDYLRRTRTILGQPALGRIDGTSAIADGRGYVFLFNPNARRLTAEFTLDETIGLTGRLKPAPTNVTRATGRLKPAPTGSGRPRSAPTDVTRAQPGSAARVVLKELYPLEGRLVGKPGAGIWTYGDRVSIPIDGGSALVLELQPAPGGMHEPMLFNAPGTASIVDGVLHVSGVRGEAGTTADLLVLLPRSGALSGGGPSDVKTVRVNDRDIAFSRTAAGTQTRSVSGRVLRERGAGVHDRDRAMRWLAASPVRRLDLASGRWHRRRRRRPGGGQFMETRMSVARYLSGAETMKPRELVYGVVREPPAPKYGHQSAVTQLGAILHQHVRERRLGRVCVSPIDVILDRERALVVQPDIVFVSNARAGIVKDRIWGAPDVVVEVLSPRTARRDRTVKLGWYRRYGVRECWLVDARARRIEVVDLETPLSAPQVFGEDDMLRSNVLPSFRLRLRETFEP